jgi:hypothetical protein
MGEVDLKTPVNPCYSYNNYTPVSCLLVKEAVLNGWGNAIIESMIPGRVLKEGNISKMLTSPNS